MADFFQPSNATVDKTNTATPSPASQAVAKFKADLLGQLLGAGAQRRPSFGDFAGGASMPARLPGGLDSGIAGLLHAMSQPGAFTSSATEQAEVQPVTPSLFSDFMQLGGLGMALYQSGAFGAGVEAIGKIINYVGGAVGINGLNPALGDTTMSPSTDYGVSTGFAEQNALDALFNNVDPAGANGSYGVNMSDQGTGSDPYLDAILNLI